MQKRHFSILAAICFVLAFWVLLSAPTGWLYDLRAGEGAEQGQKPDGDVWQLQRQEDVQSFFSAQTPATVTGSELVVCPLARLRDVEQEGTYYHRSHGVKRQVYVSEYIIADYPFSTWQKICQWIVGGYYNRYHLLKLEDGSWVCVYFDDYLIVTGADSYPTGYVRYTTTEERRMLDQMAEDYDVDPVYVLDMYRHGKVNWILDTALRLGICVIAAVIILSIRNLLRKQKNNYD